MPSAQPGSVTTSTSAGIRARTSSAAAPITTTSGVQPPVPQHPQGPHDQRLTTELDQRLRATHPPPGARGQQQPSRGGYLLISVTGCS